MKMKAKIKTWHIVKKQEFGVSPIDENGMFCSSCRLTNTMHPTNASKIWNFEPNIRYRAETVKDHFKKDTYNETMHRYAVTTKLAKYGSYFVEKEEGNLLLQVTKKSSLPCIGFVKKRLHTTS